GDWHDPQNKKCIAPNKDNDAAHAYVYTAQHHPWCCLLSEHSPEHPCQQGKGNADPGVSYCQ
ncbi:hypothetical protein ADUPG1_005754, partial [Aduncisulcus paluster]